MIILLSFNLSFFAREARNVRSLRFVFPHQVSKCSSPLLPIALFIPYNRLLQLDVVGSWTFYICLTVHLFLISISYIRPRIDPDTNLDALLHRGLAPRRSTPQDVKGSKKTQCCLISIGVRSGSRFQGICRNAWGRCPKRYHQDLLRAVQVKGSSVLTNI